MSSVVIIVGAVIVMVFFVLHTGKVHKREASIRQRRLAIAKEMSRGTTYHDLHNLLRYNQWEDCQFERYGDYWYVSDIRMGKDINATNWPEFVRQIARRPNLPMAPDDNPLETIRDITNMYIRVITDRKTDK